MKKEREHIHGSLKISYKNLHNMFIFYKINSILLMPMCNKLCCRETSLHFNAEMKIEQAFQ